MQTSGLKRAVLASIPTEISGVSVRNFLRQHRLLDGVDVSAIDIYVGMQEWMARLDMDASFMDRYLNEGFSARSGETKYCRWRYSSQIAVLDELIRIDVGAESGCQGVRMSRSSARHGSY